MMYTTQPHIGGVAEVQLHVHGQSPLADTNSSSHIDSQQEDNGAVVTSKDFLPNNAVTYPRCQLVGDNKVVQSPVSTEQCTPSRGKTVNISST